jgi:transcriptional regulator with PAS, ATPase and Fis domain
MTSLPDFHTETRLRKGEVPVLNGAMSLDESVANFEKELITNLLEQNHYSLTKTAEQLKISRHALRYRMQRLSISVGVDDDTTIIPVVKEGARP